MQASTPSPATPGPFDDLLATPLNPSADIGPGADAPAPSAAPSPPPPMTVPGSAIDPFADLLGAPIAGQLAQAPSPARSAAQARIPDDFDPMALAAVSARNSDDPLTALDAANSDVNTIFAAPTVDAIYAPADTAIAPMLADPLDPARHGNLMEVDSPLDPLLLFGGSSEEADALLHDAAPEHALPLHNHTPERNAFFRAPEVCASDAPSGAAPPEQTPRPVMAEAEPMVEDSPAPALPSETNPPPAHESDPHDAQQLLDALFRGAGLSTAPVNTLTPDAMHALGRVLAASIQTYQHLAQELPAAGPELAQCLSHIQQSVTFELDMNRALNS